MTLAEKVSRLDDYSGELAQSLEKLGIEHARGTLNRDEQMDFLGDLRRAMVLKDLFPLKNRGRIYLFLSFIAGGGATLVSPGSPSGVWLKYSAIGLALLFLAFSVWSFVRFFRLRQRGETWLGQMEAAVMKGGSILDLS
jgi:hypothetical protein